MIVSMGVLMLFESSQGQNFDHIIFDQINKEVINQLLYNMRQTQSMINAKPMQSIIPKTTTYRKRKTTIPRDKNQDLFQTLLAQHQQKTHRDTPNYLVENTKNLYNYTQRSQREDRLVENSIRPRQAMIHPRRILQIRQHFSELKKGEKIRFQQGLEGRKPVLSHSFTKIKCLFQINDINKEMQQKYSSQSKRDYHYEPLNHLRGTYSQIGKRANILKKQAYDKTFGPDISALSSTAPHHMYRKTAQVARQRTQSISNHPKQRQDKSAQRDRLQRIIKSLNSRGKAKGRKNSEEQKDVSFQQGENGRGQMEMTLLTAISNMSKMYGLQSQQGGLRLKVIEDLCKMSKQYFKELVRHKQNRLNKRRSLMVQINP